MTTGQRTFLYLILLGTIMVYLIFTSAPPLTLLIALLILLSVPFVLTVLIAVLAKATGGSKQSPSGKTVPLVNRTLMRVESFFPFDFFPDALIINEEDIVVVKKEFFFTGWTETIPVDDLKRVILAQGPFFSSLTAEYESKEVTVSYLRKSDAFAAKEMIDGLIMKAEGRVKIPENAPLPVEKEIIRQAGKEPDAEKKALDKPL